MIRLTLAQAIAFCAVSLKLEDVVLDNPRGMLAAEAYAAFLPRSQAAQMRGRALEKERAKLLRDHAQTHKGHIVFQNPEEKDPNRRLVLWKDPKAATKAMEDWQAKVEAVNNTIVVADVKVLPDDFFEKPKPLDGVVQSVRMAFMPLMASAQRAAATPKKKAPAKGKGKK